MRCPIISFMFLFLATSACAEEPLDRSRKAIERSLEFMEKDAVKWRTERGCSTCHHGTMTVWALSEAKSRGYAVPAEAIAENLKWTKDRLLARIDLPRDERPGWSLVSTPAIYLGMMSRDLPVLSRNEAASIAGHLSRHQEADGAFVLPPPANGAPPTWESRETLGLMALLAWEPEPKSAAARDKLAAWLAMGQKTDTPQAAALRLLADVQAGKMPEQLQAGIDELLKKQNADGGWSQTKELASDAYATGQSLYALSLAGVKPEQPEIQKGIAFLVTTQAADGSWPMSSRNHPGVTSTRNPIRNPIPITYFGSAWGTLGLVRSVPSQVDTAARQQAAFDQIKGFHGKFTTSDAEPDKPVISVDLRYYDVSDDEVATFASLLTAFPKLATLQIKSAKMTDAGLVHLKKLTQLEELTLEGTKVTDAGVAEFQKAMPNVKLQKL